MTPTEQQQVQQKLLDLHNCCVDFGCTLKKDPEPPSNWSIRDQVNPETWHISLSKHELIDFEIPAFIEWITTFQEDVLDGYSQAAFETYKHNFDDYDFEEDEYETEPSPFGSGLDPYEI